MRATPLRHPCNRSIGTSISVPSIALSGVLATVFAASGKAGIRVTTALKKHTASAPASSSFSKPSPAWTG